MITVIECGEMGGVLSAGQQAVIWDADDAPESLHGMMERHENPTYVLVFRETFRLLAGVAERDDANLNGDVVFRSTDGIYVVVTGNQV